jgi:hypothetical protein
MTAFMQALVEVGLRTDILGAAEPSGCLSVNLIWEHKKGIGLRKKSCRSMEIGVLSPPSSLSPHWDITGHEMAADAKENTWPEESPVAHADAAEERPQEPPEISRRATQQHENHPSRGGPSGATTFPFLHLPIELRVEIYGYLLPPRRHKIVTQLPHNGYFYSTIFIPAHAGQSFYPSGLCPANKLTTYKVLSSNFSRSYPSKSIHTEVMRVSKQVRDEAEMVLYGSSENVWDFGTHLDACVAFWGDRGPGARKYARSLRIAREIPSSKSDWEDKNVDSTWIQFCHFLKTEMTGLRTLDLTVWGDGGGLASFPVPVPLLVAGMAAAAASGRDWEEEAAEVEPKLEMERMWSRWDSIRDLLQMDALRTARITWWGFDSVESGGAKGAFDGWLAARMVGDSLVRERMVREGVVQEGVVVLSGRGN